VSLPGSLGFPAGSPGLPVAGSSPVTWFEIDTRGLLATNVVDAMQSAPMEPTDSAAIDLSPTAVPVTTRRPRRVLVWLVVVVGLGAGGYFGYPYLPAPQPTPSRPSGDAARPTMVSVAAASSRDVPLYLDRLLGTVTPLQTVTLHSRVDGELLRVLFREGQIVAAGDLLAEIDPRPFQVQLTQAEGQLARDQALLANAKLDVERYRTLLAQDSIPKQQLDTQESLVRQYEGATKIDQGLIDNAKLQLTYAQITAPISGRVGLRQIDAGNIVHAGDPTGLVVITQLQPITVVFPIPQDDLPNVLRRQQSGDPLPVVVSDRQQKLVLATGKLLSADNQIDVNGMIRLKAEFDNADGRLFPNQQVNARMLVDTLVGATVVPTAALQMGSKGTFVYVVDAEHKVSLRPVETGPTVGGDVSIKSGLAPGERVVIDGTDRLRAGVLVQVAGADGSAPAGAGDKADAPKGRGGRRREGNK
jgi:multidrug efflux system membrane fusion protein